MQIESIEPHTHAGEEHQIGTLLDLPNPVTHWCTAIEVAAALQRPKDFDHNDTGD
jgi:hypothetical protein